MEDKIVLDVSFRFVVDEVAVLADGIKEFRASCYDSANEFVGEYWATDVNEAIAMSVLSALGEVN